MPRVGLPGFAYAGNHGLEIEAPGLTETDAGAAAAVEGKAVSVAILVAGNGAIDRYLAANPDWLFEATPEEARLDPENVHVLLAHLRAARARLGALVLLAAIGASAWNIVGGYAGQVSVGHSVFFGIGAYSAVVTYTYLGLPPIAGAPIGMALSVLVAAVIGVPTLKLSGHYFSMATIAVAELVRVLSSTSEFLGGAQGLGGPPVPRGVLDLSFISATPYYYIFLAVLAGLLVSWARPVAANPVRRAAGAPASGSTPSCGGRRSTPSPSCRWPRPIRSAG